MDTPLLLAERLAQLELRVHAQGRQDSEQQQPTAAADVASAALRQSLLLEERSLELGHRDMLLRRARDSISHLQSELEALRPVEQQAQQLQSELHDARQDLAVFRRQALQEHQQLEAEIARLRRERETEAGHAQVGLPLLRETCKT